MTDKETLIVTENDAVEYTNENDRIYVVTVFQMNDDPHGPPILRQRTWGWFKDLATAVETVRENDGDIYEAGYYDTVVIEEIPWGSLAMTAREWWFRVTPTSLEPRQHQYQVTPQSKPEALGGVVGFGMG